MEMEIKSAEQKQRLLAENTTVCVDMYAEWCRPCKRIAPHYAQLAKQYGDVCFFAKEDADLNLTVGVSVLPTFLFYEDGVLVRTIRGAKLRDVEEFLKTY